MEEQKMNQSEEEQYDSLKLENQLCFPLYACSKEIVRQYKPYLDPLGLTYTQYLVMMVLWEKKQTNVKELGASLYLDSGTLTPVLKKLENKGLLTRRRSEEDERSLLVSVTEDGEKLREKASIVPSQMGQCINISEEEAKVLYRLLYRILNHMGH